MSEVTKGELHQIAVDTQNGNGCTVAGDLERLNLLTVQGASSVLNKMNQSLPWSATDSNPKTYTGPTLEGMPQVTLAMNTPEDHFSKRWLQGPKAEPDYIPKDILNLTLDQLTGNTTVACKDYHYEAAWQPGQKDWPTPEKKTTVIPDSVKIVDDRK